MKALQIIFGLIFLLPGICSIRVMFDIPPLDPFFGIAMLFWLPSFAISGFGVWLLWSVRRGIADGSRRAVTESNTESNQ